MAQLLLVISFLCRSVAQVLASPTILRRTVIDSALPSTAQPILFQEMLSRGKKTYQCRILTTLRVSLDRVAVTEKARRLIWGRAATRAPARTQDRKRGVSLLAIVRCCKKMLLRLSTGRVETDCQWGGRVLTVTIGGWTESRVRVNWSFWQMSFSPDTNWMLLVKYVAVIG